jgi:formate dehydrogenase major subunit/formate dehydrogenase alpha subunit
VPLSNRIGLTVTEMLKAAEDGQVKCLHIIGENPMTSDPDLNHVRYSLQKTEFIVSQDIFFTETGQFTDVVLPAASFVEKDGTVTNTERRIQQVRKAIPAPGEAQTDSWIVAELAKRMIALGAAPASPDAPFVGWDYASVADIMAEVNQLTPIYAGVTYERLLAGDHLQWPVLSPDHPGTPILHAGTFSRGLGLFVGVDHVPPAELPDAEYPLMLTTGRVLYHWHGGEMTRRARGLEAVYPEALIEINPKDAEKAGIDADTLMKVFSRRGEIMAKAQVTDRVEPGLIFATFHFPDSAANFLTNPVLDPTAKIPEFKVCAVRVERIERG